MKYFFSNSSVKNSYFRFMERENFELYPYQSYYFNIQALYLPQEKKKSKYISFDRLKALIKDV